MTTPSQGTRSPTSSIADSVEIPEAPGRKKARTALNWVIIPLGIIIALGLGYAALRCSVKFEQPGQVHTHQSLIAALTWSTVGVAASDAVLIVVSHWLNPETAKRRNSSNGWGFLLGDCCFCP